MKAKLAQSLATCNSVVSTSAMPSLRIRVLANPISGHGHARRYAPQLVDRLSAAGHRVDLHLTTDAADLHRCAGETTTESHDLLAVAGGDGSLGAVADHLTDPLLPVALLPCGTANSLARELRLPRHPRGFARLVEASHCLELRVGAVESADGSQRRFLCFAGVGLDAAMVHELERGRRGTLGRLRWFPPVLRVARHLPDHRLTVRFDDGTEHDGLGEVIASRIRDFGSVFRLPRGVDVTDDRLAVLLFRPQRHRGWIGTALRGWLFGLQAGRDCELHHCHAVTVRAAAGTAPAPVQADGDAAGHTEVTLRLTERRFRLLVPAGTPGAEPAPPIA